MTMDAKHLREKAALCFRLGDGLSLNNPSRFQLMRMAEDFRQRAKELEAQTAQQRQQSQASEPENRGKRIPLVALLLFLNPRSGWSLATRLAVHRQRDGVSGFEIPFTARMVETGTDDDGGLKRKRQPPFLGLVVCADRWVARGLGPTIGTAPQWAARCHAMKWH
jgi:hypothetical protein